MNSKKLTYLVLLVFAVIGVVYFNEANKFMKGNIDAGYFPRIISVILIILCIISFIQTIREEEYRINMENIRYVLLTIVLTALYFVLWNMIGFFYPLTFVFMLSLFILYKPRPIFNKAFISCCVMSLFMTVFIYIVFGKVMMVQF